MSPPMRGRGLKHITSLLSVALLNVAPHAGAWIETFMADHDDVIEFGRPPCGGVD